MDLFGLVQEYFVKPILNPELAGYNVVNTTVYLILLVLACAGFYKLSKNKITYNTDFFLALTPYILFGVSLRVIMQQIEVGSVVLAGITKTANPFELGFYFFTPGVWIATFLIVLIGLHVGGVHKKLNSRRFFLFGTVAAAWPLLFNLNRFNNWATFFAATIVIIIVAYLVCLLIDKLIKYNIFQDPLNFFIVIGQAIDGIASITAITFFGFTEQHVLSNYIIGINPLLFIAAKLAVASLICYSLDGYLKDELNKARSPEHVQNKKNSVGFVKVVIAVLGFATGLASLFKLGVV